MRRAYVEPTVGEVRPSGTVYYPNPDGISMALRYSCETCASVLGLRWWWSAYPNECSGCGCKLV